MKIVRTTGLLVVAAIALCSQACGRESADELFAKGTAIAKGDTASFAVAEKSLRRFLDRYPKDQRCDDALWWIGWIAQNRGNPQEAIARYEELIGKYPESEFSHKAQFLVGFIYEEMLTDYPRAKDAYQKVIDHYPESSLAEQAKFSIQHLGKKPEEWIDFGGAQP
ncbi:MAG: tetratricopeptide repeat protein [Candidatus Latescibacteria bacterium]|nr:tetratricopeptide repeat protein [Candidatus Latescibacterota bacterium]